MSDSEPKSEIQGEGDHIAARRFQDAAAGFVNTGQVDKKAREAAEALDGPEADELEAARLCTQEGVPYDKHSESVPESDASDASPRKP